MESSFSSHLASNYCPSDSERQIIRSFIEASRDHLLAIDDEIAQHEEQLRVLRERKEAQSRLIQQHVALLSPIRGLPFDILRTIFVHCLPNPGDTNTFAPTNAPLLLTFVCRQWRSISLGFPQLWNRITFQFPDSKSYEPDDCDQITPEESRKAIEVWEDAVERRSHLLRMFLVRTANQPRLKLEIIPGRGTMIPQSAQGWESIANILIESSSCWERLSLPSTFNKVSQLLLSINRDAVPNLRHLGLVLDSFRTTTSNLAFEGDENKLIGASRLESVEIRGSFHPATDLPFRWSQLTCVDIRQHWDFFDVHALKVFRLCPRLVHCTMSVGWRTHKPLDPNAQISLDHLETLRFFHHAEASMEHVFSLLHLPKLRKFSMGQSDDAGRTLSLIIQQCAPTLENVELEVIRILPETLYQSLAKCSRLKSLQLAYTPHAGVPLPIISDSLLLALTARGNDAIDGLEPAPMVCPDLEKIHLRVPTGPRISDRVIFEFVKARRQMTKPSFRCITIIQPTHCQEMDVVEELKKANVDLHKVKVNLQYLIREEGGRSALYL